MNQGCRVSKDYRDQPDHPALLDRRVPTALMAGMELTAVMAAVVWMALMVGLALLVHLVLRVSRDLSGPRVRRVTASGARKGSKVHRVHRGRLDSLGYPARQGHRPPASYARPGLSQEISRSTRREDK